MKLDPVRNGTSDLAAGTFWDQDRCLGSLRRQSVKAEIGLFTRTLVSNVDTYMQILGWLLRLDIHYVM